MVRSAGDGPCGWSADERALALGAADDGRRRTRDRKAAGSGIQR